MDNKPICGEWHGNDVMPNGDKLCIFEVKVGEASEILIGYRQCDEIVRENSCYEFVCFFEDAVIRWCYIDLDSALGCGGIHAAAFYKIKE